jgi:hypothetical protein
LPPIAQAGVLAQSGAGLDGLAHRIEEQVDVGRIMHVGLDHEGVTAHREGIVRTFFDQGMAGTHHRLVDAVEQLGREQAHVVLERLQIVGRVVGPVGMTEHLAQGGVLVGQLENPIVVGIEPQAQHAEHQDRPLRQTGSAGLGARLAVLAAARRAHLGEDREHGFAQLREGVDVLQSAQQLRDVVARAQIQRDGGDILFAELQLRIDDGAHSGSNREVDEGSWRA